MGYPGPAEVPKGGVRVFINHYLWRHIHNISILDDQVWFSMNGIPDCTFGLVYIPPHDPLYYSIQLSASIQEYCKNNHHIFVIGDLSARYGELERLNTISCNYSSNPDKVVNLNSRELMSTCALSKLRPINHFQIGHLNCTGNFTFRKREKWISQTGQFE